MTDFLAQNLLLFGHILRDLGLEVTPGQMIDLVKMFDLIQLENKQDFYFATRPILINQNEDIPLFDQGFFLFWQLLERGTIDLPQNHPPTKNQKNDPQPDLSIIKEIVDTIDNSSQNKQIDKVFYSINEVLHKKDFAEMTNSEILAAKKFLERKLWVLKFSRSRRKNFGSGQLMDIRRTYRNSLQFGGEPLVWEYKQQKLNPEPLIILADISGSMEPYTQILLHFAKILSKKFPNHIHTFVFGTRLTNISPYFKRINADSTFNEIAKSVQDWSGGTRIGEVLKTFNFGWGKRILNQSSTVLLITDGWDRGNPELLAMEAARLQRTCSRLIWLNPLLGSKDFQPITQGNRILIKHVDEFLPIHNLASLETLFHFLTGLEYQTSSQIPKKLLGSPI